MAQAARDRKEPRTGYSRDYTRKLKKWILDPVDPAQAAYIYDQYIPVLDRLIHRYRAKLLELIKTLSLTQKLTAFEHGGPGSGNWGHEGRPGEVGGSGEGGGARIISVRPHSATPRVIKAAREKYGHRAPGVKGERIRFDTPEELDATLSELRYGIVSAGRNEGLESGEVDRDPSDPLFKDRYAALETDLIENGYVYTNAVGKYGARENSYLVLAHDADSKDLLDLGAKYNQQSVIIGEKGLAKMVYVQQTTDKDGTVHPKGAYVEAKTYANIGTEGKDYTQVPIDGGGQQARFTLEFDFDEPKTGFTLKITLPVGRAFTHAISPEAMRQRLAQIAAEYEVEAAEEVRPMVTAGYTQGATFARVLLSSAGVTEGTNPLLGPADWRAIDALMPRNLLVLDGITQEINKNIVRELADGMARGEGSYLLTERLEGAVEIFDWNRAERFARTETVVALNNGALTRYSQAGVKQVYWVSAGDDGRTCEECLMLDGQVFDLEDAPIPGTDTHPDCRCTLAPVIEGLYDADRAEAESDRRLGYGEEEAEPAEEAPVPGEYETPPEVAPEVTPEEIEQAAEEGLPAVDQYGNLEKSDRAAYTKAGLYETSLRYDSELAYDAQNNYLGSGFVEYNSLLRYGSISSTPTGIPAEEIPKQVGALKELIASQPPLKEGTVFYRGLGVKSGQAALEAPIGSVIQDAGFQSFTYDPYIAGKFASGYLGTPTDNPVIIQAITSGAEKAVAGARWEQEAIVQAGTSWKIVAKNVVETPKAVKTITFLTVVGVPP